MYSIDEQREMGKKVIKLTFDNTNAYQWENPTDGTLQFKATYAVDLRPDTTEEDLDKPYKVYLYAKCVSGDKSTNIKPFDRYGLSVNFDNCSHKQNYQYFPYSNGLIFESYDAIARPKVDFNTWDNILHEFSNAYFETEPPEENGYKIIPNIRNINNLFFYGWNRGTFIVSTNSGNIAQCKMMLDVYLVEA